MNGQRAWLVGIVLMGALALVLGGCGDDEPQRPGFTVIPSDKDGGLDDDGSLAPDSAWGRQGDGEDLFMEAEDLAPGGEDLPALSDRLPIGRPRSDLFPGDDLMIEQDASGPACDIFEQACPLGQKCTFDDDFALSCQVAGTMVRQAACGRGGVDDCAAGLLCLSPDNDEEYVCLGLCDQEGQGCLEGEDCLPFEDGVGVCVERTTGCDVVEQDCPEGLGCTLDYQGVPYCAEVGHAIEGGSCQVDQDCGARLLCVSPPSGGGFACEPLCRTALGDDDCRSGERCYSLGGVEGTGICG